MKNLNNLDSLKQLFWSELNYERINQPLSRRGWTDTATNALVEDPVLFAGGGQNNDFHIIYGRLASNQLLLGFERPVITKLLREHPYSLFVLSNTKQDQWHFINVKYDKETEKRRLFRRITVSQEERLRTAAERITLLDLESVPRDMFGQSALSIQEYHDKAFDVESVTKQFFAEYKAVFTILKDDLTRQTKDKPWAHDYALQFLNRCMFLYFIQRKSWLGNDTQFLATFWKAYHHTNQHADTFVDNWLKILFFEAFNNKYHGGHTYFPADINTILSLAPFLNGGLFSENQLDIKYSFSITDKRFEQVFKFLERYNFTIAEDSPLDKEVAVDPEMIGKVYESLVNVSEEIDERGEAGIFYTPRTEIDLMCRLALADNLANYLGNDNKHLLNQLLFSLETDEKVDADKAIAETKLWPNIDTLIRNSTVLDPACGSGSFLVGMLTILDDLQQRANKQLGIVELSYERKKRIIGQSLYGVDVMEWACHVAELRLWLSLVVDAEFTADDLHVRREPLLPHFSFKIRCGDSLVQEVGGINLGHIRTSEEITPPLKARITALKEEKLKFYNNDKSGKYKSVDMLKQEEKRLFYDILDARKQKIQNEITSLNRKIQGPQESQIRLDGTITTRPHQLDLDIGKYKKQIEVLSTELQQVETSRKALNAAKEVPFVWDIAFVEVFEGDRDGFDIVIGNPPYVRQEAIAAPDVCGVRITEDKKEYKAKLALSVYKAFPNFFGFKSSSNTASHHINAKSDLYIYFYFRGLSLLNEKGSFCFITSNSWLDVGYGADLQEFLLKHCHVNMILDNQVKRSFANADVNSVIVLLSSPDDKKEWGLETTARFLMVKVPFEHILSPVIFDEIADSSERKVTKEYRLFPIQQDKLLEDGCEIAEDDEDKKNSTDSYIKIGSYIGNKWGGKYLRAPDIYWTILEKGKGKLVRLGDIAKVRFGIKTGANEFFYFDKDRIQEWAIEEEFLKPVIKSPRECKRILINPSDLKYKIFMCHKDKKELKGTNALEYIKWGESQDFHERPSCSGRQRWWDLGARRLPPIISPSSVSELPRTFANQGVLIDKRLYEIYPKDKIEPILLATNAITCSLFLELGSRTGLGEGLLDLTVYELAACYIVVPPESDRLDSVLNEARQRDFLPLQQEIINKNRRQMDSLVFDILDLTQGERDGVYEAVINLVEARLKKAVSI